MKIKFISLLSLIAALFLTTACDDFLDETPDRRTELDSDAKIARLLADGYPTRAFVLPAEWASDNTDWKQNSNTSLDRVQEQIWAWEDVQENTGNDSPEDYWEAAYRAISVANHALRAIDEAGNPGRLGPHRGEALIIRAYNHFNLVNLFGLHYSTRSGETDLGVPYAMEPETTVNPKYERQSVAEVYRLIEKDIIEGLPLIDDNLYDVPKYHFNKKAALAFAARFYLFYRQYDKVIEYTTQILGEKPSTMLRDFTEFSVISSDFQPRAQHYTKMSHNANLLLNSTVSYAYTLGNYSTGKKYLHSHSISSNETLQSAGPWGIYSGSLYHLSPSTYTEYVSTPKMPYYFEYTDPIARVGYRHTIITNFTADEILLCRAEAYIMKQEYNKAVDDLQLWLSNRTVSPDIRLNRDLINEFYSELHYYIPEDPTPKKRLNPEVPIVSDEQENFLHCLLHIRRIETVFEGLRWFDVKRFGIVIHRRYLDINGDVAAVLDELAIDDPRRAMQIPAAVISAGLTPNPR